MSEPATMPNPARATATEKTVSLASRSSVRKGSSATFTSPPKKSARATPPGPLVVPGWPYGSEALARFAQQGDGPACLGLVRRRAGRRLAEPQGTQSHSRDGEGDRVDDEDQLRTAGQQEHGGHRPRGEPKVGDRAIQRGGGRQPRREGTRVGRAASEAGVNKAVPRRPAARALRRPRSRPPKRYP